ncbi:MAG: tyrosine-type recombinase/integrase [Planctomycetaceae bacterium]
MAKKKPIKVHVVKYDGEKNLVLRYLDPITGRQKRKTAGTKNAKEAERAAERWQGELNNGKFKPPEDLTWAEFRDRFEDESLGDKSSGYFSVFHSAFKRFEEITGVEMLRDVPDVIDKFELSLRRSKLSTNTVRTYLKHFRTAILWAVEKGYLGELSKRIRIPESIDDMKGRALNDVEFAAILNAVPDIVGQELANDWKHYLNGLWLSGLRRQESLILSWDEHAAFGVDMTGLFPRFRISAKAQKSRKSQYLPMTPDFAEWLLRTIPLAERAGLVFCPRGTSGAALTGSEVGRYISSIGRKAEVQVKPGSDKFATCHDFRRSFGTRWARRVMPAELKLLMRHASIDTTMKYYVGIEADDIAAGLWARFNPSPTSGSDSVLNEDAKTSI